MTLQTTIKRLEARKAKLEKVFRLQHEVSVLETKVLMKESLPVAAHIVIGKVTERLDVTVKILRSRVRTERVALARQAIFLLVRRLTNCSVGDIAEMLKRNHTAVAHSLQRAKNRIETDPQFALVMKEIEQECSLEIAKAQASNGNGGAK